MPTAGELNARISFFSRALQSDGYGGVQPDFNAEPEFTVPAQVRPKLGGEDTQAGRLQGHNLANIIVRRSANTARVTTSWKAVNAAGAQFNIRSIVDPDEATPQRGRWLEMLCEEGVAQ